MLLPFFSGFGLGLSFIAAIGAQNAFVLQQGLLRQHVLIVCLICALSDAVLITAGVAGFGWLIETLPWVGPVFRWAGAAFLIAYGIFALRRAWLGGGSLSPSGAGGKRIALTALALTWLNPHVYLDTLVLLGSISAEYGAQKWQFATGAVTASFVFFFSLGYGARLLSPLFARPLAWRALDLFVAVIMWSIAFSLIRG